MGRALYSLESGYLAQQLQEPVPEVPMMVQVLPAQAVESPAVVRPSGPPPHSRNGLLDGRRGSRTLRADFRRSLDGSRGWIRKIGAGGAMYLGFGRSLILRSKRTWLVAACAMPLLLSVATVPALADCGCGKHGPHLFCRKFLGHSVGPGDIADEDAGGHWMWVRSPEQERRVAMTLFNRYCIRCHSVDGRGVWDIPDVPDFANVVWQNTRPDEYRARVIIEGRGAVMPSFRGIITVEESWALARYLHSFLPGQEVSRPGLRPPGSVPGVTQNAATSTPTAPTQPTPAAPPPPAPTAAAPAPR